MIFVSIDGEFFIEKKRLKNTPRRCDYLKSQCVGDSSIPSFDRLVGSGINEENGVR